VSTKPVIHCSGKNCPNWQPWGISHLKENTALNKAVLEQWVHFKGIITALLKIL